MQESRDKIKVMYAITKANWGGAQQYVYTLATSLPNDKYEVVVACGEGNILKEKLKEKGIRVLDLKFMERNVNPIKDIKTFFQLYSIIKNESPDVLHLNSSKIGGIGGFIGRMVRVPKIIFTAHGWAFNESRPWIQKKVIAFLHWLTVIFSHTTIAVSRKTKKDIDGLPLMRKKVFVVHNGIESIEQIPKKTAQNIITKTIERKPSPFMIGTIAELHKNKGLNYLLEAAKGLPDEIGIYIIGSGEEEENLKNKIKEFKLDNIVFLTGKIDGARKLLKAFDIFILPSITEALPGVILEAGSAGIPIIATRVGGIPEIIENGKTGILIAPKRPNEIRDALIYLLEKPEKRKLFAKEIKSSIEKNFSLNKMIDRTKAFYTQNLS